MDQLLEYLPFGHFLDPNKRIYWPYLALSLLYAVIFLSFSRQRINAGWRYWFHASAIADYLIWIGNHLIQILLFPTLFMSSLSLASQIYRVLQDRLGDVDSDLFSNNWGIVYYSITYFLVSDFTRFILHYWMHHNSFLWRIHRTHHTAEVLTPITFFRVHPLEMMLFHLRFLIVHGAVTGLFIYLYKDVFDFPTIFGASFFVFFTNILGGNLRHSPVPIGFGFFEKFLISPKQHQMHHSTELKLQRSNYGSFFAFWDKLFGTWRSSDQIRNIKFGISEQKGQNLFKDLAMPFFADRIKFLIKRVGQKKHP
jgi:sterol desaturase/sphingolipid hydroxylase (fatty acid hydroxylase superfamily)